MAARKVGAAVVHDADSEGIGILTERDVLEAVAKARIRTTSAYRPPNGKLVFAAPSWSLEQAAEAMVHGGFRHLVVLEGGEVAGRVGARHRARLDEERAHATSWSADLASPMAGQATWPSSGRASSALRAAKPRRGRCRTRRRPTRGSRRHARRGSRAVLEGDFAAEVVQNGTA